MLQPPLVQAIFSRNAEEVQLLLHKTEDVNALVCKMYKRTTKLVHIFVPLKVFPPNSIVFLRVRTKSDAHHFMLQPVWVMSI